MMRTLLLTLVSGTLGGLGAAQELTVFAASSLTEAFEKIAATFEAQNEGVEVLLSFDGSSTLATQISQGAPADVFASADEQQMQRVVDEGLTASEPQIFTRNRLVVITPAEGGVTGLEDLAEPGLALVLADAEVPVGSYTREALEKMNGAFGADFSERVLANLVSEESNVRQVSLRVELGEADAAVVYATDASVAGDINVLEIPDELNVLGTYPVAALSGSAQPKLAQAFADLVLSAEGQRILTGQGFGALE